MKRYIKPALCLALVVCMTSPVVNAVDSAARRAKEQPPNIIYLMLYEWGYFENRQHAGLDFLKIDKPLVAWVFTEKSDSIQSSHGWNQNY